MPCDKDQYHFTDPNSRIMKNSTNAGFDQHYKVQVAIEQDSLLIVAPALSNHPNDQREVEPTLQALSPQLGQPKAAALDNGYFSEANVHALEKCLSLRRAARFKICDRTRCKTPAPLIRAEVHRWDSNAQPCKPESTQT